MQHDAKLASGIAVAAIGGYGRRELFPYSDVDLLFLLDSRVVEKDVKDAIRRRDQELWDCGIRVSPTTRTLAECEQFDEDNAEFALSLLDHRLLTGDAEVCAASWHESWCRSCCSAIRRRSWRRLWQLTRDRHAKYGDTLFHLEPNIKDCPGGLRDVNVCGWVAKLLGGSGRGRWRAEDRSFDEAVEFLRLVRCFLHYRHERDDNMLDWQAQDAAAEARDWAGRTRTAGRRWMRRTGCGSTSGMRGVLSGGVTQMMEELRRARSVSAAGVAARAEGLELTQQQDFASWSGAG